MGAAGAGGDLVRLAELLQAPVATTFQGKSVFPEGHPLWLWPGFGAFVPPFARKIADSCDATLAIGCRFSEVGTGSYGLQPPGPLIHVDIDPSVLGVNYKADFQLVSDSAQFVTRLLDRLTPKPQNSQLRDALRSGHAGVWEDWDEAPGERVSPPRLLRALQEIYGPDTIFCTDSGNGTFLAMECLRLNRPRSFLAPVDYSCMGYSVPAAVGAAHACPERPVVALAGDGAFLMTGLELLTAAQGPTPVTVLVLRDRELAQIAQFQRTALARTTASELPDYDLSAICAGVGASYIHLARDEEIAEQLGAARAIHQSGRPVVVEVEIDYSRKTYFTKGVVRTNLGRLPWRDRARFIGRALGRRILKAQ